MKKILFFSLAFFFSLAINAQKIPNEDSRPEFKHPQGMMKNPDRMKHRMGMMMEKLNLTDAQKGQLKTEKENFRKQIEELRKNDNITVKDWRNRMQQLRDDHKSKIQGIFTPEQKAKMEKFKSEMKARQETMVKARIEKMKEHLGLNSEQSLKIDKAAEEMKAALNAIKENKTPGPAQKMDQLREIRKQHMDKLKSILTEEQLKLLKERKPAKRVRT